MVLILPMRNGNLKLYTKTFSSLDGSYPTYEEWKLLKYLLARRPISLFLSYLWGMETDHVHIVYNDSNKVLILPMRNGNPILSILGIIWLLPFLSYLWGMETNYITLLLDMVLRFLSYLWGMETLFHQPDIISFCHSSYPTYEEWKHLFVSYYS